MVRCRIQTIAIACWMQPYRKAPVVGLPNSGFGWPTVVLDAGMLEVVSSVPPISRRASPGPDVVTLDHDKAGQGRAGQGRWEDGGWCEKQDNKRFSRATVPVVRACSGHWMLDDGWRSRRVLAWWTTTVERCTSVACGTQAKATIPVYCVGTWQIPWLTGGNWRLRWIWTAVETKNKAGKGRRQ